jgi:hypothetical protein
MAPMVVQPLMHDILEAHCPACGFSLTGLRTPHVGTCSLCGADLALRSNLNVTRQLPIGLGLLIGAFVASRDASPLLAREPTLVPGFARRH